MNSIATKRCSKCGEVKPAEEFYERNENGACPRRRSHCKACLHINRIANREPQRLRRAKWYIANKEDIKAKAKAYAEANPERVAGYKQKYSSTHPDQKQIDNSRRRARKAAVPCNDLTAKQWIEIKAAYKQCCAYCGKKTKLLTQDHIVPISKLGPHTASNTVPACRKCNAKKGTGAVLRPVQPLLLTFS